MSLRAWEIAIEERLKFGNPAAGLAGFGSDAVFVSAVPDEAQVPRLPNRMVRPYVAIWYGQRIQGNDGYRSICGVRASAYRANFLVQVMAHDGSLNRDAVALVSDLLLGFKPAGQGELLESSSSTIRRPLDMSGVRGRISVPVAYSGTVDL